MSTPFQQPEPEPGRVPPPLPQPFPPRPVREPDPGYLPDEAPVPNPDENENPPKQVCGAAGSGDPRTAVSHLPQCGVNRPPSLMF